MASAKTYESKGKINVELPDAVARALGIRPGDEVEFREVYGSVVAIVPAGKAHTPEASAAAPQQAQAVALSKNETAVLKKINTIRHDERTAEAVDKVLTRYERAIYRYLTEKKIVFPYSKAGKQFIGIDKKYFGMLAGEGPAPQERPAPAREAKPAEDPMLEALAKEGYLIVENPALAKDVDEKLKREKRESDYRGVRGFDKKYYLISKSGLAELEKKFDKALAKEKQLKAVADELGVKEGLAKAAIEVLREEGKIIEKRRGTYCLA